MEHRDTGPAVPLKHRDTVSETQSHRHGPAVPLKQRDTLSETQTRALVSLKSNSQQLGLCPFVMFVSCGMPDPESVFCTFQNECCGCFAR